jgi:hypothetical protein
MTGSGAGIAWSDIQIDFWNRHLINNNARVFSLEIKELGCKLLCVICRLCIYIMSSMLLVYMNVLHEPFLPCSSVSRAVLSWSFWRCGLNLPVFSLVMRCLAFSITLVISKFEVTNYPLSSIRDGPWI